MLEIKKDPTPRELRQFAGLWFPLFWGVVGWLLYRNTGLLPLSLALWLPALLLSIAGVWKPALIRPVFIGMMVAVFPIGFVISHLLLGIVYYLVLTPVGLLMRLLGRDPLHRRFDSSAPSYWISRPSEQKVERYFRQF